MMHTFPGKPFFPVPKILLLEFVAVGEIVNTPTPWMQVSLLWEREKCKGKGSGL